MNEDPAEGDRYYAAAMHVIVSIGWVYGLFAVDMNLWTGILILLAPVIMWLAKSSNPFIHQQGKNLLKFIVTATVLIPIVVMSALYAAAVFFASKGYTAETRAFFIVADRMEQGSISAIGLFATGGQMMEKMKVHSMFYIVTFIIIAFTLLRPVLAPLRGAWRAYKGRPSDYQAF